jgi:hypothetical protein
LGTQGAVLEVLGVLKVLVLQVPLLQVPLREDS